MRLRADFQWLAIGLLYVGGRESFMNPLSRSTQVLVWGGLGLVIAAVTGAFWFGKPGESRTGSTAPLPVISRLEPFSLTNHLGRSVTLESLRGRVWVADVIFTRCAGPCLQMTQRMRDLRIALGTNSPVELVSFTTDPEFDTPEVLQSYARKLGAESPHWQFVTGRKPELARVLVDGLKFTALEKKPEERTDPADLFIHSTFFVVVDKQGRARRVVEGLETDYRAKVIEAVGQLTQE